MLTIFSTSYTLWRPIFLLMTLKATIKCDVCGKVSSHSLDERSNLDLFNQIKGDIRNHEFNDALKKEVALAIARKELELKKEFDISKEQALSDYRKLQNEKDDAEKRVAYLEKYQMSLGSKDLGEDLETNFINTFNQNLAGVLPNATFGKDNDSSTGSKGDLIYREKVGSIELLSIMFDAKTEFLVKKTNKNKNHNHYDKLDKDRRKANCEWACLGSTLEPNNPRFSNGMTLVHEAYSKMIVFRPENFIETIITLRILAQEKFKLQMELKEARSKNTDVSEILKRLNKIENGSSEYVLKIRAAVKNILKKAEAISSSAKSITKNINEIKSALLIEVLENADAWEGFIVDITNENSETNFLSQETNEKEAA